MTSVVVIGCGRVGSGLAQALLLRGEEVTVVDCDPVALDRLPASFRGRRIVGAGSDRSTLAAAGCDRADALAAVTGDDEVNAVVALAARRLLGVPRVVARLYDPRKAAAYEKLGVSAISPVAWGIERLAELVTSSEVAAVAGIGLGGVDLLDVRVPGLLVGRPLGELEVAGEIEVVALTRAGRTFLPEPGTRFRAGDLVHVAVTRGSSGRLGDLLGEG